MLVTDAESLMLRHLRWRLSTFDCGSHRSCRPTSGRTDVMRTSQ
jgi:hypothetical protein